MCERTKEQLELCHLTSEEVKHINGRFDGLDIDDWRWCAMDIDQLDDLFGVLREMRDDVETDEWLAGAVLEYLIQELRIDPKWVDYGLRQRDRRTTLRATINRSYLNDQERKACMARHPASTRLAVS